MAIRVAFTLIDKHRWVGGYQYQINLFRIWREFGNPRILPVLFVGQHVPEEDIKPFRLLMEDRIITSPVFNQKRKKWRLMDAILSGKDRGAEKIFNQNHIDVIFDPAVYYGRSFGVPVIAWITDFQHRQLPELFNVFSYWKREIGFRVQIAGGMTIMVSSETAKRDCEKFYPTAKGPIFVVPFAVVIPGESLTGDLQEVRLRYQLPSNYFYLPNQFWKHKNHETVIEALNLLKNKRNDVVVATSGQPHDPRHPDLYDRLQMAVRKYHLEKNFISLGVIPYEDVLGLMRTSVAVINPSLMEGWSTTVEEAKSLGVPLILSDIPIHREQASTIADFFNARSPASLAHVLDHGMSSMKKHDNYQHRDPADDVKRRVQLYAQQFADVIFAAYANRKISSPNKTFEK
jgi:glycosyltransferase involved in cell wall biosynthesis